MSRARVFLSLGSNLGDRRYFLQEAVGRLNALDNSRVLLLSSLYETKAWGKTDQDDFYNIVLLMETDLDPLALLDATQAIEKDLGRLRHEHWGPRTLDIDLLLYNEITMDEPRLRLPHPYMHQRRFVLEPLMEIAPDLCIDHKKISDALEVLQDEQLRKIGPLF